MLFLGLLFERSEEHLIAAKSRGGFLQNQVNTFQWNCIDGLHENGITDLTIVNALPVGIFPRMYSDFVIKSKEWIYNGRKHFQIGSINLPLFKQWGRYLACKKLLKQLDDKEIIIYSTYQPFLKAVSMLDESFKVTLIVPDLPEYYDYAKVGKVRRILRKINNKSIEKLLSRVDRFVLLTDDMKEPLEVGNRPYVVVEGICSSKTPKHLHETLNKNKIVVYAGSMHKQFGIDVLIGAFELIQDDAYELWLCGQGDYQDEIILAAKRDKRIKYYGFVPKDEVSRLQSMATVLVNPRQNIGEYTKYSFPSKTMECLLSGIPTVCYKLDGIPEEYGAYLNYVDDNSPEALRDMLVSVCEDCTGKYTDRAERAIDFLVEEKNPTTQSSKIINLINGGSGKLKND